MHPGWPNARNPVPPKRNTGLGGEGAGIVHDETERRKEEAVAAAAPAPQVLAAPAVGGTGPAPPPPAPPPTIIDRWHKWSFNAAGAYIYVGLDHDTKDTGQTPPPNPGYAPANSASTINGAYTKALSMLSLLKPTARVIIVVHSGIYVENLVINESRIDFEGRGRPVLRGQLTILPQASDVRFLDFHVDCPDVRQPGVHVMAKVPVPGFIEPMPFAPIQFYDCWFSAPTLAFYSERRVYLEQCRGWRTTLPPTPFDENPPVVFQAAYDDFWWSHAVSCWFGADFNDYNVPSPIGLPPYNITVKKPSGFAVKATAKSPAYPMPPIILGGLTAQTDADYAHPTSGLMLVNCRIDGSLLVEGWTVEHKNCDCVASPSGEVGGFYSVVRGWRFGDPLQHLPGRVFFDHSRVQARVISLFESDPMQPSNPMSGGGKTHFRHSVHLNNFNAPSAIPFVVGAVGIGAADVVQSCTSAASWISAGGPTVRLFGNCPTSTTDPGIYSALYDPYYL